MRRNAARETCERCQHQRERWCLHPPGTLCRPQPWQVYRYLGCEDCLYNAVEEDCACQDLAWPCDYRWRGFETQGEAEAFADEYTITHHFSETVVLNLEETPTLPLN